MNLRPLSLALTTLCLAATAQADEPPQTPHVLFVFAHPDDELFVAPAIARAVRAGQDVAVVYATSGDQGPGVSSMEPGPALAIHREAEASCAMEALGVSQTSFLKLGDGTLGIAAHRPESPARLFGYGLSSIFDGSDIDMVVTWGPDGGYGHADHRMVSAVTTQLVQAMPEGERPDLLYPGIRAGTLPPDEAMKNWAVTAPELLDVSVEYDEADLAAAHRAAQCHESQFDEQTRQAMMPGFDQSIWQGVVHFRSAFGR